MVRLLESDEEVTTTSVVAVDEVSPKGSKLKLRIAVFESMFELYPKIIREVELPIFFLGLERVLLSKGLIFKFFRLCHPQILRSRYQ